MAAEEVRETTKRTVSTQDLSWILEHDRRGQLDLDPPYQRRSVWTPRDRRSFMDTVFKNYPSPPIYLHKTIDLDTGNATYHVVDGKQRISTVLAFLANKVYLPVDFGDERLAGKRWRDLREEDDLRASLWNYRIIVEEIDDVSPTFVREVFERLNKNSRKLTAQELRHARFDGWLISFLEDELAQPLWRRFKIQTTGKEKRMTDVQNLAELAMITRTGAISGFDQGDLDEFFAELDDIEDEALDFDVDDFLAAFHRVRDVLGVIDQTVKAREVSSGEDRDRVPGVVAGLAQPFGHFYTLWSYVSSVLDQGTVAESDFGHRYRRFMEAVHALDLSRADFANIVSSSRFDELVIAYKAAALGASTDLPQRTARLDALQEAMSLDGPEQAE